MEVCTRYLDDQSSAGPEYDRDQCMDWALPSFDKFACLAEKFPNLAPAPAELCKHFGEDAAGPFICTGSQPKGALEILSLSYANAELAFALLGSLFVAILYKTKKAKDPDFLQEDELLNELSALKKANAAFETRLKRLESA